MEEKRIKVILEKGDCALIERGTQLKEIAVVRGLNDEKTEWKHTIDYWSYEYEGKPTGCRSKAIAMFYALDLFCSKTEENHVSYARLSELATLSKDGLIQDDYDSAMEYFADTMELTQEESEFFGIDYEEMKTYSRYY